MVKPAAAVAIKIPTSKATHKPHGHSSFRLVTSSRPKSSLRMIIVRAPPAKINCRTLHLVNKGMFLAPALFSLRIRFFIAVILGYLRNLDQKRFIFWCESIAIAYGRSQEIGTVTVSMAHKTPLPWNSNLVHSSVLYFKLC